MHVTLEVQQALLCAGLVSDATFTHDNTKLLGQASGLRQRSHLNSRQATDAHQDLDVQKQKKDIHSVEPYLLSRNSRTVDTVRP